MKSFKQFLKDKIKPVIVDVLPVHGSHAHKKEKDKRKNIKEDYDIDAHQHTHLKLSTDEFKEKHGLSRHEWNGLNNGYKASTRNELLGPGPVTRAITDYTDHSRTINHALVKHHSNTSASYLHSYAKYKKLKLKSNPDSYVESPEEHKVTQTRIKTQIKRLDHAFKHSKLKHDTSVMHGCGFDPDEHASQHPERHIHLPAYTSTSSRVYTATSFGERNSKPMGHKNGVDVQHSHILRIDLPKGHSAIPILHHSSLSSEHETLLPRGMKLKISDKPYHVHEREDFGTKYVNHYWDAHPVESK